MTGTIRISDTFVRLREKHEKGLITYVTAGYPNLGDTFEIAKTLSESGSDLIEIGIPFSDPIADGPVIQRASQEALAKGIKQADIFRLAGKLRRYTDIPILLMTYYNPVMRAGIINFVRAAQDAGVDGLIVPDLPVGEDEGLRTESKAAGLSLIPLAAPTSTDQRLAKIGARADGFIYCVSVAGVTGSKKATETDLKSFTDRVKRYTSCPLAVGFGVSGPEMAAEVSACCDAVVVGSAIIRAIKNDGDLKGTIHSVGTLTSEIKNALRCGGIEL